MGSNGELAARHKTKTIVKKEAKNASKMQTLNKRLSKKIATKKIAVR